MKKQILSAVLFFAANCTFAQINFQSGNYYYDNPLVPSSSFNPSINFGSSLGGNNTINGDYSVAKGISNTTNGYASFASGVYVETNGIYSHGFGSYLRTEGQQSFTFGTGTLTTQFVNPHEKTFAVSWESNTPAFVVRNTNSNQYVGIGTFDPTTRLHIMTNDNEGLSFMSTATNQRSTIQFLEETGGLNWNITAYNDFVGGYGNILEVNSHNGGNFWVRNTTMMVGDYFNFDACTDCSNYRLFVRGGIRTEEVKVDISSGKWADYVFDDSYELKSLEEVKEYIKQNGHLPNIPSAQEVESDGIKIGELNTLLLEKIEELTLYTIEQEERIKRLESQLNKDSQ